ncbi:hypothetical protein SAMN05444358_1011767 [Ruegeria halocynthiae]|uniref:Uncharacterized protein n=1 Tax=Ruegeria halocynthiae TaxID=985054 RepID=A0A1H2WEZ4_9RHOB|nr:hypothetical protein SAMN05444358_1011767 [Ruegeria halocynthiae]
MTLTKRSESTIFVRAGMPPANDRFGDMGCETELGSLQMQTYAASAKGRNRMTASSRERAIRNDPYEWRPLNQRSLHITPLQRLSRFVMVVQGNPWLQKLGVLVPVQTAA